MYIGRLAGPRVKNMFILVISSNVRDADNTRCSAGTSFNRHCGCYPRDVPLGHTHAIGRKIMNLRVPSERLMGSPDTRENTTCPIGTHRAGLIELIWMRRHDNARQRKNNSG